MKLPEFEVKAVKGLTLKPDASLKDYIERAYEGLAVGTAALLMKWGGDDKTLAFKQDLAGFMVFVGVLSNCALIGLPEESEIIVKEGHTDLSYRDILSRISVHGLKGLQLLSGPWEIAEQFTPEIARRCLYWAKVLAAKQGFTLEEAADTIPF